MKWRLWPIAIAFQLVVVNINCENQDDEEPHDYTISFFQFDPRDIGVGSEVKKESKKDIKPSDAKLLNQLGNYTDNSKSDIGISNNTNIISNETEVEQRSHTHWNTTASLFQFHLEPTNVQKKPPLSDHESYKKNETELDGKNIQAHSRTNISNTLEDKNEIKNSANIKNGVKGNEKVTIRNGKETLQLQKTKKGNDSTSNTKESSSILSAATNSTSGLRNSTLKSSQANYSNVTKVNHLEKGNFTSSVGLNANGKNTTANNKKSHIPQKNIATANRKATVLNPNPSPSQTEAAMHLKNPQFQGSDTKTAHLKSAGNKISEKNVTTALKDKTSTRLAEKSVTLIKKGVARRNETTTEHKPIKSNKPNNDEKQIVVVRQSKQKNASSKNEAAEKLAKLEKDKKINKEIQENAKKIKPVQNTVENVTIKRNTTTIKTIISGIKKHNIHIIKKNKSPIYSTENGILRKSQIQRNREILSHFIPSFDITPRDRTMGFQVGSLKHLQHDLYPKCYHCPINSTYAQCVKRSTIKLCNNGLNNICFAKSHKRNNVITYQMGCTDHKRCSTARAFPCRDGSKDCFTCCQFNNCNSSPHHGDYEIDALNMAEIELNTKNKAKMLTVNWFYHLIILLLHVVAIKMHN